MIITKNQEKKFKTEVVASFVEVCYFGDFDYYEVFKLASFITGEEINMCNIHKYREVIMNSLNETYPDLTRHIYLANGDCAHKHVIDYYRNYYIEKYGKHMLIKSIKKVPVKTLKYENE